MSASPRSANLLARLTDPRGRPLLAVGVVAWTAATALMLALPPRSFARALAQQSGWTAMAVLMAVGAFQRAGCEPRAAAGWRLLSGAMAVLGLAAASVVAEMLLAGAVLPFPMLGDWLQLPAFAVMGFAFLLWPLGSPSASIRLRAFLDATLFAVAIYATFWALVIGPMRDAHVPGPVWAVTVGQFALMAILLAITVYLGAGDARRFRGPLGWLVAALLAALATAIGALAAGATNAYYLGQPTDGLAGLSLLLLLAGSVSRAPVTGAAPDAGPSRDPMLFGGWVTYGAVFLAFMTAMWVMVVERKFDQVLLLHGFAVILLLVARQLLAVRDVRLLTRTLEEKVERRTRELEASQLALQRTARLEALGRLAGGVAHDINNLLMGIVGYAEILDMSVEPTDPRHEDIVQIRKAVERGARLTRQLLAFARKQPGQPKVLDAYALVSDLQRLLDRLIGSEIRLTVTRTGAPGCVRIDPGQLEQVLVNLAVNAVEAMPRGGTLTVDVASMRLGDGGAPEWTGAPGGEFVRLSVSDTGVGMSSDVLARIFEPFFTTKTDGKGTGLGLATCYGIVQQAGGFIAVESEPGRGTRFDVYLPRCDEPAQWAPAPEPAAADHRGTETVLLAEDDPNVRNVVAAALLGRGYDVLVARDGEEAVAAAGRHAGSIHLFVTDMSMPGMSGLDAAQAIIRARPGLKVLVVSGYLTGSALDREALGFRYETLSKPVSPTELLRKVRALLDETV